MAWASEASRARPVERAALADVLAADARIDGADRGRRAGSLPGFPAPGGLRAAVAGARFDGAVPASGGGQVGADGVQPPHSGRGGFPASWRPAGGVFGARGNEAVFWRVRAL